jgi:hypothetical protein
MKRIILVCVNVSKHASKQGFGVIKSQGRQQTHDSEEAVTIRQTSAIMCTKGAWSMADHWVSRF